MEDNNNGEKNHVSTSDDIQGAMRYQELAKSIPPDQIPKPEVQAEMYRILVNTMLSEYELLTFKLPPAAA